MQTHHRRKRPRGYTMTELMVAFSMTVLLIALLYPLIERNRRGTRITSGSSLMRGIIQGCINFAPGNNEWYPGINGRGEIETTPLRPRDAYGNTSYHAGAITNGAHPAYRYAVMIQNALFTPEYAINPSETKNISAASLVAGGNVEKHYSYAMLMLTSSATDHRTQEWKSTTNSKAVIMSDRNLSTKADTAARSIHDETGQTWRGVVGYNDNHVHFETTNLLPGSAYAGQEEVSVDDLFAGDANAAGVNRADAAMVFDGPTGFTNHKF